MSYNREKKMKTNKSNQTVLLAIASLAFAGCASITGQNSQSMSFKTRTAEGPEVVGASCEVTNNKGKWFVTTPGSVQVTRSNDDMQVLCGKAGLEPGRAAVVSDTKAAMFGNILFGGGIGAIIDHKTGAAYEYPNFVEIVMGGFTTVNSKTPGANGEARASAPTPAAAAPSK
jgi:hypothetical protein